MCEFASLSQSLFVFNVDFILCFRSGCVCVDVCLCGESKYSKYMYFFFFIKIHKTGFLHLSIAKYLIHIILSFMFNLVHLTRFNSPIFPLNRLKFSFPLCSCLVFILFLFFIVFICSVIYRTPRRKLFSHLKIHYWASFTPSHVVGVTACVLVYLCLWVCLQWVLFCPKVQQVQSGGMIFVGMCMCIWA